MAILIVIDSAQTEVPRIVGQVIDGIKYTTIDESGFASAIIPSVDKSTQALKVCFGTLLRSRRLNYLQ